MLKKANFSVYITSDYSVFKKLLGNRSVDRARVEALKESIKEVGFLNNPILVNEKMEVIDGQGRLEALKALDMPVPFIIHNGASMHECLMLNIKQKNWTTVDYCKSYAEMGNENYIRLAKACEVLEGVPAPTVTSICLGRVGVGGYGTYELTRGLLQLDESDLMRAVRCKPIVKVVKEAIKRPANMGKHMPLYATAFAWAYECEGIDKERILQIANNHMEEIPPLGTTRALLDAISACYNKALKKKSKVALGALYELQKLNG